jgi:hypothetical protein
VNAATLAAAGQAGLSYVVGWDVASNDPYATASQIHKNVMDGVKPGSVVLMHAGPPAELAALPGVISALRARGFTIAPLAQVLRVTIPGALLGSPAITETGTYNASVIGLPTDLPALEPSFAIDAKGFAHVAYASRDGVWYATNGTTSGAWTRTKVVSNAGGVFFGAPSLALSPAGVPSVAYEAVSASGTWVGIGSLWHGYFALRTPRLRSGHLTTPSLAIDRRGVLHLAFRVANAGASYGLWRGTASCATCIWSLSRADASLVDIQPSIALDSAGHEVIAFRRSGSGAANGTYLMAMASGWHAARISGTSFIPSVRFDGANRLHLALESISSSRVYTTSGAPGALSLPMCVTANGTGSAIAVTPAGQSRLVVTKWDAAENQARLFVERP